jgi:ectoine hydroxylase-related dioxygenase (phytanoyl-CoA dioxygenase family)
MLDSRQRGALDETGYVILPDVVAGSALAAMREVFERAAAEQKEAGARERGTRHVHLEVLCDGKRPQLPSMRDMDQTRVSVPTLELPDEQVKAVAAHVIARPFGLMNTGGRDPLPGFGQQGLHADWRPRKAWEPFHVATAIWLLDDFTAENGATRVVPGSHRKGGVPKSLAIPENHHPEEKLIVARAGSVLVFNGHFWHGGTRNRTNGPRRSVQCMFVASELLNPSGSSA